MASKRPQFAQEGFCRTCGTRTSISAAGQCEACWKENRKEVMKNKRANMGANNIKNFLTPFAEQIASGAKPSAVLVELLNAGGFQVEQGKK